MRGTETASNDARRSSRTSPLKDAPNTVVAVVSTCVAALCAIVVGSQLIPARNGATETVAVQPVRVARTPARDAAEVVHPDAVPDIVDAIALGFADPVPSRSAPAFGQPGLGTAPRVARTAPVRIIAGPPPVVPAQRPDRTTGPVQLASTLSPARALGLPGPTPRPTSIGSATTQVASLRPAQRPVTLSTRTPDAVQNDTQGSIVLAAATPEPESQPRQLIPPRAGANPCSGRLTREIPRRPGSAADGSTVMASLTGTSGSNRDNALLREALNGNIPSHLRDLLPVRFTGLVAGRQTEITLCVTPDYVAIGSDRDHVRVPMGLPAALRMADAFDMMLPTTRMVDAIYAQADVRLSPRPMEPGAQMASTAYFVRHDATLDQQMANAGARAGLLVAGHKKDVVIANRLAQASGRVAIYGWHRSNGAPIQPLSTVHGEYYADYSHGIRLVSRTAYIDGRAVDLRGLLTDTRYASLLNSDGPLSSATVRLASLQ